MAALASETAPPSSQPATTQPGDDLVAQIHELHPPAIDRAKLHDLEYRKQLVAEHQSFVEKQQALIAKFLKEYPDHPKAGQMFLESLMTASGPVAGAKEKIDAYLVAHPQTPARKALTITRAVAIFRDRTASQSEKSAALDQLASEYPDAPPLDAMRIRLIRDDATLSAAEQNAKLEKLAADAGDRKSPAIEQLKAELDRGKKIGQTFELTFEDAATGKPINLQKDLKGKIVVIDFWATWCGPCVAEMPNMKQLYADFHGKGVEFIGVSLDAPEAAQGKEKLLEFVKKNDIPWPQYYQGNGWESGFSKGWGIDAIPQMFVVDADGKLANVEARGKLEKLLPELLAKHGGT